ncbi:MAG: hypothetical protein KCHDKBKB_02637 [Elusimicrobia bacterium]|nr:hypothetical protein [Elusimicrobiota bacterium]
MKSQFHVNLQRKQVIIVAPACHLAGAQVLYFPQNLFQYDLKKQNLGPAPFHNDLGRYVPALCKSMYRYGQEACRGDVHFGCGGDAV